MEPEGSLPCSQESTTGSCLFKIHPVHTFSPYFHKIHSNNIISPSTPRSYEWSLSFKFSDQHLVFMSHLSHSCYMSCPVLVPLETQHPGISNRHAPRHQGSNTRYNYISLYELTHMDHHCTMFTINMYPVARTVSNEGLLTAS